LEFAQTKLENKPLGETSAVKKKKKGRREDLKRKSSGVGRFWGVGRDGRHKTIGKRDWSLYASEGDLVRNLRIRH